MKSIRNFILTLVVLITNNYSMAEVKQQSTPGKQPVVYQSVINVPKLFNDSGAAFLLGSDRLTKTLGLLSAEYYNWGISIGIFGPSLPITYFFDRKKFKKLFKNTQSEIIFTGLGKAGKTIEAKIVYKNKDLAKALLVNNSNSITFNTTFVISECDNKSLYSNFHEDQSSIEEILEDMINAGNFNFDKCTFKLTKKPLLVGELKSERQQKYTTSLTKKDDITLTYFSENNSFSLNTIIREGIKYYHEKRLIKIGYSVSLDSLNTEYDNTIFQENLKEYIEIIQGYGNKILLIRNDDPVSAEESLANYFKINTLRIRDLFKAINQEFPLLDTELKIRTFRKINHAYNLVHSIEEKVAKTSKHIFDSFTQKMILIEAM